MLTSNVKCKWLTHITKILCTNGFPYVWENQGVVNEKQLLYLFEQRPKDIFIQECLSDISLSPRCRMYKCENTVKITYTLLIEWVYGVFSHCTGTILLKQQFLKTVNYIYVLVYYNGAYKI